MFRLLYRPMYSLCVRSVPFFDCVCVRARAHTCVHTAAVVPDLALTDTGYVPNRTALFLLVFNTIFFVSYPRRINLTFAFVPFFFFALLTSGTTQQSNERISRDCALARR